MIKKNLILKKLEKSDLQSDFELKLLYLETETQISDHNDLSIYEDEILKSTSKNPQVPFILSETLEGSQNKRLINKQPGDLALSFQVPLITKRKIQLFSQNRFSIF